MTASSPIDWPEQVEMLFCRFLVKKMKKTDVSLGKMKAILPWKKKKKKLKKDFHFFRLIGDGSQFEMGISSR